MRGAGVVGKTASTGTSSPSFRRSRSILLRRCDASVDGVEGWSRREEDVDVDMMLSRRAGAVRGGKGGELDSTATPSESFMSGARWVGFRLLHESSFEGPAGVGGRGGVTMTNSKDDKRYDCE